jgi:hypothetical protein
MYKIRNPIPKRIRLHLETRKQRSPKRTPVPNLAQAALLLMNLHPPPSKSPLQSLPHPPPLQTPINLPTPMWPSLQWLSTTTSTNELRWPKSTTILQSSFHILRRTKRDGRIPFGTTCRSMIVLWRSPKRELARGRGIIGLWVSIGSRRLTLL